VTPDAIPSNLDLVACYFGCFFFAGWVFFLFLSYCCFFLAAILAEAVVSVLGAAALPAPPGLVLEPALLFVVIVSSSDIKDIDTWIGCTMSVID
jgi:hypothetical protein